MTMQWTHIFVDEDGNLIDTTVNYPTMNLTDDDIEDDDDYDFGTFGYDPLDEDSDDDEHYIDIELIKALFGNLVQDAPDNVKITIVMRDTDTDSNEVISNDDLGAAQWAIEQNRDA